MALTGFLLINQTTSSGANEDLWIQCIRNDRVILYFNDINEFETKSGGVVIENELELEGDFNHDGSNVGFYGTAPAIPGKNYRLY